MRKHTFDDEVELRLVKYYDTFYYKIQWRFKPKVREVEILPWPFEFKIKIKSRERWHTIMHYNHPSVSISSMCGNPYDTNFQWNYRLLDISRESDRKDWGYYKKRIKNYNDLNFLFNIESQEDAWERDKRKYDELYLEAKKAAKEIEKMNKYEH